MICGMFTAQQTCDRLSRDDVGDGSIDAGGSVSSQKKI